MKLLALIAVCLFVSCISTRNRRKKDYPIKPVDFTHVRPAPGFWTSRIDTVSKVTIPFAFKKCEETGRIKNFIYAAGIEKGQFQTKLGFDDSDVYKIIEGASYTLMVTENPQLKTYVDTLITYIAGAQEDDGYLYTARTLKANDYKELYCTYSNEGRFIGSRLSHELYNAGHMYEAAVAHYLATGERSLLDVAVKNADLIYNICVEQGENYFPGHQEIEIGLVKLYRITDDERYLKLAKLFLDRRGKGLRSYDKDAPELWISSSAYAQDHMPVIDQDEAVGHAVRAAYMYAAMADIAALTEDREYLDAIDAIWKNVVEKKLYLTGGIGAGLGAEDFGENYQLPNHAYAETCAAIANVYWNHRMFLLHGHAKYIDVLERTLYNGLISGISLDGTLFFYPNPLKHDGKRVFNHGGSGRMPWFECSCCPSNLSRFIPSVAGYVYAVNNSDIYINLFMNSETEIETAAGNLKLQQSGNYPWQGDIQIKINNDKPVAANLLIRIPGWTGNIPVPGNLYTYADKYDTMPEITINNSKVTYSIKNGYAKLSQEWKYGDNIEIKLPMPVRRVLSHKQIKENQGLIAFERGPIVYCAEGIDNQGHALNLNIPDQAKLIPEYNADLFDGVIVLKTTGKLTENGTAKEIETTLIPYYTWNHRGDGEMAVWLHH